MKLYARKDGATISCWASKDNSKNIKITAESTSEAIVDKREKTLKNITNMITMDLGSPFIDIPHDNIEY